MFGKFSELGGKNIANGVFPIYDTIDMQTAEDFLSYAVTFQMNRDRGNLENGFITLAINSNGGDVMAALSIVDIMNNIDIPVYTLGMANVSSAALMLFMAGRYRVCTENTTFMTHRWSGGMHGKSHDLDSFGKFSSRMTKIIVNHYHKCTGLEKNFVTENLMQPQDIFFTPQQALKYNMCDKIRKSYNYTPGKNTKPVFDMLKCSTLCQSDQGDTIEPVCVKTQRQDVDPEMEYDAESSKK